MDNYFINYKKPVPCKRNNQEVEFYGEIFIIECDGKWHIFKNKKTEREFVAKGRNGRIVFCPDYVNRDIDRNIDKEYKNEPIAKEQIFENFRGFEDEILKIKNFIISDFMILFIFGIEGVGKTHLANALKREIIESKKTAEFITAVDLQNVFLEMRTVNEDIGQKIRSQEKYNKLKSCNLLIIDDLGRYEKATNFFQDQLCDLIDKHLNFGKILITTNKILKDNEAFSVLSGMKIDKNKYLKSIFNKRIISRLINAKTEIIRLEGRDKR